MRLSDDAIKKLMFTEIKAVLDGEYGTLAVGVMKAFEAIKDQLAPVPAPPHPDQPVVWDGPVLRFKRNKLIDDLIMGTALGSQVGCLLNDLRINDRWSTEDWDQLAQLIGYSLGGYQDLSYVSAKAKDRAEKYRVEHVKVKEDL